ncbi:MAG: hypothetical protein HFI44_15275 [Lachnospiraceae bacterium]|nr:hypothetical protein [Lachnospiraceae bacterium]
MKRERIASVCMAVCLVLGMFMIPINELTVQAAEVIATVQGTVSSGTTSELLKLSTKEGNMEIKLDSGTDTSACKILLPGQNISVSVARGSDEYLHAVKITSGTQTAGVTVDSSNTSTISGTISDKSKDDLLYVNTTQGEMQIKMDVTTNMSGCSVLVVGKSYSICCARGADAYMHAVSISDSSQVAAGKTASTITPAPASYVNDATTSVSGTVTENTKENLLYLSTKDGEMQIVIDNNTDSRSGMVLTPGNKLTVSVYRGTDAYMHAAYISASKNGPSSATVDMKSMPTVSGTVGSKSNENVLYLSTAQGEMELKLDMVRSVTGCKVFVSGKKLTVVCARGSDAYMHAIDITGA